MSGSANEPRAFSEEEENAVYKPLMRTVFAVTRYDQLLRPDFPHFIRRDWLSVFLPLDMLDADPRPREADTAEGDPPLENPELVSDPWRIAIWGPFMDTIVARGSSEIVLLGDSFEADEPRYSWLDRWLLGYGKKPGPNAVTTRGGVIGPADWNTIACANSLHFAIHFNAHVVFPLDRRWGALCFEDRYTLLGGEPDWMDDFAGRSGGYDAMRTRLLEDGLHWPKWVTEREQADERERLPRVANWGRRSA